MFYFPRTHFESAVSESRRKHLPLFLELRLSADSASTYYEAGPIILFVTAGELNKCRKLDMDNALAKKMGVGKIYRLAGKDSRDARIIFKLYYQPSRGWTTKPSKKEGRIEQVFDAPESVFLRWIVEEPVEIDD